MKMSAQPVVALAGLGSVPLAHAIDFAHLSRMTLGEHSLEREVLSLFDRQAGMLLSRMSNAAPAIVSALAHTLKGSARGVGAWRVALAAEAVERTADEEGRRALAVPVDRLAAAIDEAHTEIAELLRAH